MFYQSQTAFLQKPYWEPVYVMVEWESKKGGESTLLQLFFSKTPDGKSAAPLLLEQAARKYWNLECLPPRAARPGGKPYFPSRPDLCFSLSHSGPYALCALSRREVGADVEVCRPRRESLPRKALSKREYDWFQARGCRWEDFYTLWTLKEAFVKWQGTGLTRPPCTISVPLLETGESAREGDLTFTAYSGRGWRGALCSPDGRAEIQKVTIS